MMKFVTITGIMTYDDAPVVTPPQPPGIWGPTDPRPTLPIAGWNPGTGAWPSPLPPLGIWGPTDPRPTPPIQLPPWAGGWQPRPDGGLPPFPSHPIVVPPGGVWPSPPVTPPVQPPGSVSPLPGSDPSGSGWVFGYVPGYGWMWAYVPGVPKPPTTEPPTEPTEPTTPA